MRNVKLINIKGKDYILDIDKSDLYHFNKNSSFERYKAVLRNPELTKEMDKLNKRDMELLKENSRFYDPKKHKFKGEK